MGKHEEYSRKIADYIYDDMESGDRAVFEAELERNEELAEEYHRQVQVVNYLKARTKVNEYLHDPDMEEADRLVNEFFIDKDSIGSRSEEMPVTRSRSKSLKYILYPLTAAAAIIGGVLIINTFLPGDLNDRIYKQYYAPMEDASLISRGGESDFNVEFDRVLNLYFEGDYSTAASEFTKLAEHNPQNAEAAMFMSLSVMGAENYEESAMLFESYLNRFETYQPEAKWYLALCYLKLDRPEKAITLLTDLASLGGKLGDNSQRIVQRLR